MSLLATREGYDSSTYIDGCLVFLAMTDTPLLGAVTSLAGTMGGGAARTIEGNWRRRTRTASPGISLSLRTRYSGFERR